MTPTCSASILSSWYVTGGANAYLASLREKPPVAARSHGSSPLDDADAAIADSSSTR
jgi:hypothetical protein